MELGGQGNLTTLPSGLFQGLNFEKVHFTGEFLRGEQHPPCFEQFPENLFAGIIGLEEISLINSYELRELAPGFLAQVPNLKNLTIANNRLLSALPPDFFSSVGQPSPSRLLERIDLSGNMLTSIPAMGGLGMLKDLQLDDNELSELPSNTFTGLASLTNLKLHGNRVSVLHPGTFRVMSQLRTL